MISFGLFMIIRPQQFADGVSHFSEQTWFHAFEISSRLTAGAVFIALAFFNDFSSLLFFFGLLFCFVGLFLIWMGPSKHRKFAIIASKIGRHFRPLGYIAVLIGLGIAYTGWQG
jgi:sulfite exporter TauE/SafE